MQGKVESNSSAPAVYAGIDVSKDWLDVYVHPAGMGLRVSNSLVGLRQLRQRLGGMVPERIVLEATGKYHRMAHRTLSAWGFAVGVVNPLRSRLFAEACGVLGKTDRIDARILALMGEALRLPASTPASEQLGTRPGGGGAGCRQRWQGHCGPRCDVKVDNCPSNRSTAAETRVRRSRWQASPSRKRVSKLSVPSQTRS